LKSLSVVEALITCIKIWSKFVDIAMKRHGTNYKALLTSRKRSAVVKNVSLFSIKNLQTITDAETDVFSDG